MRPSAPLSCSCGAQVARGAPQGSRAAQSTNGEMASPAAVCHRCGGIAARVLIPGRTFLPPTIPDEAMASASDETRRTRRSAAGDMTSSTRGGGQEPSAPGLAQPRSCAHDATPLRSGCLCVWCGASSWRARARAGELCALLTNFQRLVRQAAENAKSHGNRLRRGAVLP